MSDAKIKVLVVGATGSIGSLVVKEAVRQGHTVRALVRSESKARHLPPEAEAAVGDLTRSETLMAAVQGVDAIVFTHGSDGGGKQGAESVDYGGVRNVLQTLGSAKPRIALMTAIGVTYREGSYNRSNEVHDWKRRGERLVRSSGCEYTIVRPGWFDYNKGNEHHLEFLQGDTRRAGNSSDGVIARQQLAEVLVASLASDVAAHKTFELVATKGPAQADMDPLFGALESDPSDGMDGVHDENNQPLEREPQRVRDDLRVQAQRSGGKPMRKLLLATLLAASCLPALQAQQVRLAKVGLGMSEAELKQVLGVAPRYTDRTSSFPGMASLLAVTEEESYLFTLANDKVIAFSLVHLIPAGQQPFLPAGQEPTVKILRDLVIKQTWAPERVNAGDTF